MYRLLLWATVFVLLAAPARAAEQMGSPSDEEALRKQYAAYDAAWNAGDAQALARLWTEDADHVDPDGQKVTGRAALEKLFADRFHTDLKGTHSQQTVESIRFIKPDVAVIDAGYAVTGAHDAAGKILASLQGRYVDIWVRTAGTWRIAADRPLAAKQAPQ